MTQPTGNADASRFQDAYDRVRDELNAVAPSDYVAINTDVPHCVATVLGVLPRIRALRPQVVTDLPNLDIAKFDKLETYTLALGHAHAGYMAASHSVECLETLNEEGAALRHRMIADAHVLATHRHIDPDALKQLKLIKGYRNVAFDLLALSRLFRDHWTSIQGKCALQFDDLKRAEMLADHILNAVGHREHAPAAVLEADEMRQRAYTLFVRAYELVQRAVHFLRWDEEDWEVVAPSIYNARGAHHRKGKEGRSAEPA